MHFLKRTYFHFFKASPFNECKRKCGELVRSYDFMCCRNYCASQRVILKHHALGKYVDVFRKEFETNQSKKYRGIMLKKIEVIDTLINEINSAYDNIKSLNDLRSGNLSDESFLQSLMKELEQQEKIVESAEEAILLELMPNDENESCNEIILEVTAGVGGQEAMLFAQNLYELYCSYIDFKNWDCQLTDLERTELGGVRHASLLISGFECYKFFRFEGGVHRVQRIPKTEKTSRMHTSTATVAILPQPAEIDVVIHEKDLKVETKTARGPGGQHVNKTETAVRIHHIPTGIIVDCQVHKSQFQNKKIAMQKLRSKLYAIELEKSSSDVRNIRKFQVGSRSRNEKVRTYNFSQDRITDHRFNITVHNLERYFEGSEHFDNFLHSLLKLHNERSRKEFLDMLQSTYG